MQVTVIIGAAGGLGQALLEWHLQQTDVELVIAVSRQTQPPLEHEKLCWLSAATPEDFDEQALQHKLKQSGLTIDRIICCIGVLHQAPQHMPEKKLADLNRAQLDSYFSTNTVLPVLWTQLLAKYCAKSRVECVWFSARVGSIKDNRLGGWYGYRASKAALNMMAKTVAIEQARSHRNWIMLCYHPGTVDTALSEPFQRNVKPEKLFTADFSAQQLVELLPTLEASADAYFIDWEGQTVEW